MGTTRLSPERVYKDRCAAPVGGSGGLFANSLGRDLLLDTAGLIEFQSRLLCPTGLR